jgi:vacuolar-type H+-ATPase subunit E/Vma4
MKERTDLGAEQRLAGGYGDLLRALSDEVERDARTLREEGAREAERLLAEARAVAAGERERALAAAEAQGRAALARARAAAAREGEAAVHREARRRLDALRADALAVLRERGRLLLPRLVDELCARLGEGPATLRADADDAALVREHLARAHPELAGRVEVEAALAPRGGLELVQDGVVLDDTLAARIDRAWEALEPALARLYLGAGRGGD